MKHESNLVDDRVSRSNICSGSKRLDTRAILHMSGLQLVPFALLSVS
jgi:hypothetical protein